jgi:hypothetical protein
MPSVRIAEITGKKSKGRVCMKATAKVFRSIAILFVLMFMFAASNESNAVPNHDPGTPGLAYELIDNGRAYCVRGSSIGSGERAQRQRHGGES